MFAGLPVDEISQGFLTWDNLTVENHILYLLECYWYEDEEGFLYIADLHCDGCVHGPDNEKADQISLAMAKHGPVILDEWVDGLLYIPEHLHRFDPMDGFYHA